jgi:hypothetical protein
MASVSSSLPIPSTKWFQTTTGRWLVAINSKWIRRTRPSISNLKPRAKLDPNSNSSKMMRQLEAMSQIWIQKTKRKFSLIRVERPSRSINQTRWRTKLTLGRNTSISLVLEMKWTKVRSLMDLIYPLNR